MNKKTKVITTTAMLSAIAGVLMLWEFPIPLFPVFLEIDFSDLPALLAAFLLGPAAGGVVVFMKIIINLMFNSTVTGFIGEAANFIIGIAFILPAGLVYKSNKTKKGALTGMLAGIISMAVLGALANYFILIPLYIKEISTSDLTKLVLFSIVPFNILKGTMVSLLTLLIYKRLSHLFKQ